MLFFQLWSKNNTTPSPPTKKKNQDMERFDNSKID